MCSMTSNQLPFDFDSLPESIVDPSSTSSSSSQTEDDVDDDDADNGFEKRQSFGVDKGRRKKCHHECHSSLHKGILKKKTLVSSDSTLCRQEKKSGQGALKINGNFSPVCQNRSISSKHQNIGSAHDPVASHRKQQPTTIEQSKSGTAEPPLRLRRVERGSTHHHHHSQYTSIGLEDVYEQDENCVITETDLGEIGISEKRISTSIDHAKTTGTTLSYVKESSPFSGYTPLFQRNANNNQQQPKKPISSIPKKDDDDDDDGDLIKRRNTSERIFSLFGHRMPQSKQGEKMKNEEMKEVEVGCGSVMNDEDLASSELIYENQDVQFEQLQSPSQVLSLIRHFQSRINRTGVDTDSNSKVMTAEDNVAAIVPHSLPPPPPPPTSLHSHQISETESHFLDKQRSSRDVCEIDKTLQEKSQSFSLTCDKEAFEAIEQLDKSIDEVILYDVDYKPTTKSYDIDILNSETKGTSSKFISHDGISSSSAASEDVPHYMPYANQISCQTSYNRSKRHSKASVVECHSAEETTPNKGSNAEPQIVLKCRENLRNFTTRTADASVNTDFDLAEETSESSYSPRGNSERLSRTSLGYSIVALENNNITLNNSETNGLDNNRKSSSIESVEEVQMAPVKPRRKLGNVETSHRMSTVTLDGAVVANTSSSSTDSVDNVSASHHQGHFVVVAIDFGTTFSGYAFCFTRDADNIHMMRKWEGGDPGVVNQKTLTTLLLTPEGEFNSFGFTARDNYHDLDPLDARRWLYFDKFKMTLHHNTNLSENTEIKAANGVPLPAIFIFSHVLRYFKEHALQELSDQAATRILNEDVRWVITVPAIWRQPAKQFMRQAAYEAGIASAEYPDQLLIALEPEAASIYCRKLRIHQLVSDSPAPRIYYRSSAENYTNAQTSNGQLAVSEITEGTRYMVVDCGGGTVDITVHEIADENGNLRELHKPTGGPCGSVGVDMEFENLLNDIFGADFMEQFKVKRPAGYVDLMMAFEARKRNASPFKNKPLNVSLPFSFVDYYKKCKGNSVENAIKKYGRKTVQWSSQGMLRLDPSAMKQLFVKVIQDIKNHVAEVVSITRNTVRYLFLVGGFAESQILQQELRQLFDENIKVIIPQDVSLAVLKGAVLYGLDPTVVHVRRSRVTYGVGVLNRYVRGVHPEGKRIVKDGVEWCTDVFDRFVSVDQSVGLGDVVLRSYTPARVGQKSIVLHVYCSESDNPAFITDEGVRRCGSLQLDLSDVQYVSISKRREIQTRMLFGDTEVKLAALDVATGKCVRAQIDFLNH